MSGWRGTSNNKRLPASFAALTTTSTAPGARRVGRFWTFYDMCVQVGLPMFTLGKGVGSRCGRALRWYDELGYSRRIRYTARQNMSSVPSTGVLE